MTSRLSTTTALWLILLATAALWIGVATEGLNADDYQYIQSLAPMRSGLDIVKPFWSSDANPSFFRPLSNATMVIDFLISGWNGHLFHLTNLLFHLIAVWVVFYFVRDVFGLSAIESVWVTLIFGLTASHEYNLVVDTARADVLVTILMMLSLIISKRGTSIWASLGGWFLFALALCAKEIAIVMIVLAPILLTKHEDNWKRTARRGLQISLPYLIISILFYFYHAHFTENISYSQPLLAEGGRSLVAMIRNGIYGIGYLILPLSLEMATKLLTDYRIASICVAAVLLIGAGWLIIRINTSAELRIYIKPLLFMIISGSIVGLSFERWRLYLPSIGLATIIVLGVRQVLAKSGNFQRSALILFLVLLSGFHLERAVAAEYEWHRNTKMLTEIRDNLTVLLAEIPQRPLTLLFLTSPSKLGSATVMQLGQNALLQYSEAARNANGELSTGLTGPVRVWSSTAIELYALDSKKAFDGLNVQRISPQCFSVSVDSNVGLMLVPSGIEAAGVARRDARIKVGDSVKTNVVLSVMKAMSDGKIKETEIISFDPTAVPVYFDGQKFRKL